MTKRRLKPEARKEDILAAALVLAERRGYATLTREAVAQAAEISGPTLHYHFGTMAKFQRELMRYAIRKESLPVVAQGMAAGDKQVQAAPVELRQRAFRAVLGG